jgi:predicted phage terminase large subunit-like protein
MAAAEWTAESETRLAELLTYEDGAETLTENILRVSPRLPPPAHLEPLIALIERTRHERILAVVQMPPRHAKTTTGLHGLSWRMGLDPSLRNAFIAYAESLSLEKSRICQRLAQAGGVPLGGSQSAHFWETKFGGSFLATSIGGGITGKGIDGIAWIDDPHKDRAEAESRTMRDRVWDWFTDTFWTRMEDNGSVLVVQTRWHKDDLAGRLLKGFEDPETGETVQFEEISLPALAEKDDPMGREVGEALWPERYPRKKLLAARSIMGPYGFSSLYQQRPQAKGKQIFSDYPARFEMDKWDLDGHRVLIVCDPATSEKTSADHTVIGVVAAKGYGEEMEAWVLDWDRGQWETPAVVKMLKHFQTRWWGVAVGVEAVAGFKGVPQTLRAEDPSLKVLEIIPVGDKWLRSQNAASAWTEGRYHIPVDRPWAKPLIAEATDFTPRASVDDQIDVLAHAWNTLFSAKAPRKRGPRRANHLPFG